MCKPIIPFHKNPHDALNATGSSLSAKQKLTLALKLPKPALRFIPPLLLHRKNLPLSKKLSMSLRNPSNGIKLQFANSILYKRTTPGPSFHVLLTKRHLNTFTSSKIQKLKIHATKFV